MLLQNGVNSKTTLHNPLLCICGVITAVQQQYSDWLSAMILMPELLHEAREFPIDSGGDSLQLLVPVCASALFVGGILLNYRPHG